MADMPSRRTVLKTLGLGALASIAVVRGRDASAAETDGTPLQFIPKTPPDSNPLEDELTKYPKCPYCGMDRTQWQHSRHLVQYQDDLVDGTCSIHCAALSLALNMDRGPKAIYAADYGSDQQPKPLIEVDKASYLIGSKLPGTMTKTSKLAFGSLEAAKAIQADKGGEIGDFHAALRRSYADMAEDTIMIRMKRAERRKKMAEQKKG
jgi:copper chaperone NosL